LRAAEEPAHNGFSLKGSRVAAEKILAGGPARDEIRSVDAPEFVPLEAATWVGPSTPVLGLELAGEARAYPVHLMEYHQVVNDELAGKPVVVTYDPIAGAPVAYRSALGDRRLSFGVSGLIHQSNFLLYDRETESLWSQLRGDALAGPLSGSELERLRIRQEPMAVWAHRHPGTRVLARPEPDRIDYRHSPYSRYWVSEKIPFAVDAEDRRYHPKEVVLGVVAGGVARAYLGSILTAAGGRIVDEFEGRKLRVAYDTETATFVWEVPDDVEVQEAYWFAWKAFHPETGIWGRKPAE